MTQQVFLWDEETAVSIRLPTKPTEEDYEDFVAAGFLTAGHFIETNLRLSAGKAEVLELDVVATPIAKPFENVLLVEAKSGSTGFSDIFKMYGWMKYLNVAKGCLVRTRKPDKDKSEALQKVSDEVGIQLITADATNPAQFECLPSCIGLSSKLRKAFFSAAWYGRIAQRVALRKYYDFCKSYPQMPKEVLRARNYRWHIQEAFFAPSPIRRAHILYDAYGEAPRLTGQLLDFLSNADPKKRELEETKVRDTEQRLGVQYVMMMEHTARLGILKNALLHTLQPTQPRGLDLLVALAPPSFKAGLKKLKAHPHREKIPLLFQLFVEVFGGFCGVRNDDHKFLAACVDIPPEDIPGCLDVFDDLFPTQNGWFFTTQNEIRIMKAVPAMFRGAGCFLRQDLYTGSNYRKLFPKMGWLLTKWHNAIYAALEPALKVPDSVAR